MPVTFLEDIIRVFNGCKDHSSVLILPHFLFFYEFPFPLFVFSIRFPEKLFYFSCKNRFPSPPFPGPPYSTTRFIGCRRRQSDRSSVRAACAAASPLTSSSPLAQAPMAPLQAAQQQLQQLRAAQA